MIAQLLRNLIRDWPWKLVCLIAATAIWLGVASEPELATEVRAPVQYKNGPHDLEISSDTVPVVEIELSGLSGRLKDLSAAPPPVILDFGNVRNAGERTFNIDTTTIRLPRGVQLVRAVPAQLRYVFEERLRRSVPVVVQWSGSSRAGERIARVRTDPAKLTVVGPKSRVERVESVSTDPVNVDRLQSGKTVMTSPFIAEPRVRFGNFQPVRVTVLLRN